MKKSHQRCHICDGHETLESALVVQMDGIHPASSMPICAAHMSQAEAALRDIQASEHSVKRSAPVIINLAGVCGNSWVPPTQ